MEILPLIYKMIHSHPICKSYPFFFEVSSFKIDIDSIQFPLSLDACR